VSSRRWGAFFFLAGAGHAAIFAALPAGSGARESLAEAPQPEIDIVAPATEEVSTPSPAAIESERRDSPATPNVARAGGASPALAAGNLLAAREQARANEAASLEVAPGPPPNASGDTPSEPWTLGGSALPDVTSSSFVARATQGIGTEGLARRGPSTSGGLVEGLDARDVSVGMGRGRPVISALEAAVASAEAPFEGAATFDVGIDTSGHVSVALLDASVASPGWSRVAAATRAALDPSRLRIPPGAGGWHVVARVEAKVQYPNGLDPKKLGTAVGASPGEAHVTKDGLVLEKVPGVTLAHSGKVCSVRITLGLTLVPIAGGCDPSNIGLHTLRVVHAHVLSEGRL
jgi:hypothetical protein